ncbi:PGRS family protein [Sorangium sp. So ce448]|uniref:PGRS family protein n=1 Tax=Sorangium sp. So ce448 TaxID=3133314 RepID=UPI003F5F0CA8
MFVRLDGDDDNDGTPGAPVKSLEKAIALATAKTDATKKNVYACAETFEEAVEIAADVTLFGGLDCENGWRWIGEQKRTTLTADAGGIPLTMHEGAEIRMEDVDVVAKSIPPEEQAMFGKSSIAAVADGITMSLARCTIAAGDAARNAKRPPNTGDNAAAEAGKDGNPGREACMPTITPGGAEQSNDCEEGVEDSLSGAGGPGLPAAGNQGLRGTPGGSDNGGVGQASTADLCKNGRDGVDGTAGEPGAGAGAMALGTLSREDGYTGVSGLSGLPGVTAQGGGGGGGARGIPNIANPTPPRECPNGKGVGGASGGSGGAGGCGGKGGPGGNAGGSSIALISIYSTLEFNGVTLKTGRGGDGDDGWPGQPGGDGGKGGEGGKPPTNSSGLDNACSGGRGGRGGQGGTGGGGRGGHSIGIAFLGTPPPMATDQIGFEIGDPGLGGQGEGNDTIHNGADGDAAPTLDFTPR